MMRRGLPALVASDDARTTKGAVYTNADVEQAMRIYGFRAEDVVPVVGNPDLMRFGFEEHMLGAQNRPDTFDLPYVMYVDTALAIVGLLFKSLELLHRAHDRIRPRRSQRKARNWPSNLTRHTTSRLLEETPGGDGHRARPERAVPPEAACNVAPA